MKLDTRAIRYLTAEDWRVLTAVEMGSRNHEIVPTPLIVQLSGLRGGSGVHKSISSLAKNNLIAKVKNAKYDGYRLTYGGLDYLALHAHHKSQTLYSTGNQIGTGKESDIFVAASHAGTQHVLKIHRLGRISFRTVKTNRDYLRNRSSASWMYMSRLAALKEFACLKVLHENGFVVPRPIAQNRHTIVMELIDAFPLRQIRSVPDPPGLYAELMSMIVKLAGVGLIHGDFNEFNILVEEVPSSSSVSGATSPIPATDEHADPSETLSSDLEISLRPIMIDFPQMVSTSHSTAPFYFDRDVSCVKRFFARRFGFTSDDPGPFFSDTIRDQQPGKRLDVEVEASGFSRKMAGDLEKYMKEVGAEGAADSVGDEKQEDTDDEEESLDGYQKTRAAAADDINTAPLQDGMAVLDIQDVQALDAPTVSHAGSVLGQRTNSRQASKAAGWVI